MGVEKPAEAGIPAVISYKKAIVPFEREGPVEEPLFTNMCQVAYHDGIVYIDVGIVPLDEISTANEATREVTFNILSRLVMGVPTLKSLKDQVVSLVERLENRETL